MKKYFGCLLLFYGVINMALAAIEPNFLVISDTHLRELHHEPMVLSPFHNSLKNDLDPKTFENIIKTIHQNIEKKIIKKPDFIILLGDLVGHKRTFNHFSEKITTHVLQVFKTYFPNTPILYTFGNNDALDRNYGLFQSLKKSNHVQSIFEVNQQKNLWRNGFLSSGLWCSLKNQNYPCLLEENPTHGYYAVFIAPKFRLIALNTVFLSPRNATPSEQAIQEQFTWLDKQLALASKHNESVMLTMHVPLGQNVFDNKHSLTANNEQRLLSIIKKYQPIIRGLLASHTHTEELKIIHFKHQKASLGLYFAPSLSTIHGNRPAIKTITYDQDEHHRWQLKDYEVFDFFEKNQTIQMERLYSYQEQYCPKNVTSMNQCLMNVTPKRMESYYLTGNTNQKTHLNWPKNIDIDVN